MVTNITSSLIRVRQWGDDRRLGKSAGTSKLRSFGTVAINYILSQFGDLVVRPLD